MPSSAAFAALDPAPGPAMTRSVLAETDPATLAPSASARALASARVIRSKVPVNTTVRPAMALPALALWALTVNASVEVWMVYALVLARGTVTAVDNPARQSFVFEMVGPDRVVNAVALNSVVIHTARILGPAAAGGVIVLLGVGPCFLINAVSFAAMIVALRAMDPSELRTPAVTVRAPGQLRGALKFSREQGTLGRPLADLGSLALRAGKRAQSETGVGGAGASLGAGEVRSLRVAAGGEDLARLVCCRLDSRIPEADMHALERAATVAALLITREEAVSAVENKYQGDFLRDVFLRRAGDERYVEEHAEGFGWQLDRPVVVVAAEIDPAGRDEEPATSHQRRRWQERFSAAWRQVTMSLDEGIPRAVDWFRAHRAAHPDEDRPVVNEGDSVGWKTLAADPG